MKSLIKNTIFLKKKSLVLVIAHQLTFYMVMLVISSGSPIIAQTIISDEAARAAYADCRLLFEEKKFTQCYHACQTLTTKMGRKTRKVQWLLVEAGYNAYFYAINKLTKKQLDSASASLLSYKNLSGLHAEIRQLEALMDSSEYWYSYVRDIDAEVMEKVNENIYQKDRTPEKAVLFLNECTKLFPKSVAGYNKGNVSINFSINKDILKVDVSGKIDYEHVKDSYFKGELLIPLSKVSVEKRWVDRIKNAVDPIYIFNSNAKRSNTSAKQYYLSDTLPVLIGVSKDENYQEKLLTRRSYEKSEKRAASELKKAFQYDTNGGFYLFQFFNESILRFKDDNYDEKIEETFRYLIDYFKNK